MNIQDKTYIGILESASGENYTYIYEDNQNYYTASVFNGGVIIDKTYHKNDFFDNDDALIQIMQDLDN